MSYCVTKKYSNGYRCSCCTSEWSDTDWWDDLKDALEEVPTEPLSTWASELLEVEIKDGTTGDLVAWGHLTATTGFGKYSGYKASRWKGHRPDIGDFDVINGSDDLVKGRTWEEILEFLQREKHEQDLKKAQRDLEVAQKRLADLTPSEKGDCDS